MWRRCIANIGHWRTAELRSRRHAPPHLDQLATAFVIAYDWRFLIRKHARHARKIAGAVKGRTEQATYSILAFGDAVKIAHGGTLTRLAGFAKKALFMRLF
jgi:hypothetical protein